MKIVAKSWVGKPECFSQSLEVWSHSTPEFDLEFHCPQEDIDRWLDDTKLMPLLVEHHDNIVGLLLAIRDAKFKDPDYFFFSYEGEIAGCKYINIEFFGVVYRISCPEVWMCGANPGSHESHNTYKHIPIQKHTSKKAARQEATRLAEKYNCGFYILKAVELVEIETVIKNTLL